MDSLPIEIIDVSRELVLDAANIKAHHNISYAYAFVVATAIQENAVVITGDPEFKSISPIIKIDWLM